MAQGPPKGKMFFVIETGICDMAHRDLIQRLKDIGWTEVCHENECDLYLVFCPITSRVGTDVGEAEARIPDDKPAILVVMHPKFDPNCYIPESRAHVKKANILLTVDCLFYNHKILDSDHIRVAWEDIQRSLGVTKVTPWNRPQRNCRCVLIVTGVVIGVVVVLTLVVSFTEKKF